MERDDYADMLDTALEHLRRAADLLFNIGGMEEAFDEVENAICSVETELSELDSLND